MNWLDALLVDLQIRRARTDLRGRQSFKPKNFQGAAYTQFNPAPPRIDEMALIQDILLTVNGFFSFQNIPQNFKHLRIYVVARQFQLTTLNYFYAQFNATATFGDGERIFNNTATTVVGEENVNTISAILGKLPGRNATANYFGMAIIEIGDYATSGHTKSLVNLVGGVGASSTGNIETSFNSSMWHQINPITRIDILGDDVSFNFVAGSRATLYGVT